MRSTPEAWIREVGETFRRGGAVRRELPEGGRLEIDRPLPYLFVHRSTPTAVNDATAGLLRGEAAYLVWRGDPAEVKALRALVRMLAAAGAERFGAFLLVELWDAPGATFRILCPDGPARSTVAALEAGLAEVRELRPELTVAVEPTAARSPPGAAPLLDIAEAYELGCLLLGLEVPTVYLQPGGEETYPPFYRHFRARLSRALRRAVFDFVAVESDGHFTTARMLGPRAVADIVWGADRALEVIGGSFDFLLLVSPIDEHRAWEEFRANRYGRVPDFHYRLLPVDPDVLKRRLYELRLEEIDDAALFYLLNDKREELDKQVSMLSERGSPSFLFSSLRLYHPVDDDLLREAEAILEAIPPSGPPAGEGVGAEAFRARALEEFGRYRSRFPAFAADVQIRSDVAGLMVSRGNLLIDERLDIDPGRVEALIQHEVGTHVVTFVNGAAQPLRQLASGLADYDELQEGLGILAEYLVGGLTPERARVLAARVVAARAVEGGADFVETFRRLTADHGFSPAAAFGITERVFHGGGFTRDIIYLRGFMRVLAHLRDGGDFESLYIGKIAMKHAPVIEELRDREVLREPPLRPLFLERRDTADRLAAIRQGRSLAMLLGGRER